MLILNNENCTYNYVNTVIRIVIIDTFALLVTIWWLMICD